jgi:hypothetical protein
LVCTFIVLGWQAAPEAAGQGTTPTAAKADHQERRPPTSRDLAKDNPIVHMLPRPIQDACLRYCPGDEYRALRATWGEVGTATTYAITFFHTGGLRRGGRVGDRSMEELFQYTMTLGADGRLIEEQQHPIAAKDVPPAVLDAYKTWNRNAVTGMVVAWGAEKSVSGKRTFTVSIVFSQIEVTGACFLEDGRLIKEHSDPTPSPRPERPSSR